MKLMNVIILFGMLIALDVTVTLLVAHADCGNKQDSAYQNSTFSD